LVQLGKHKIMKIAFQAVIIVITVFLISACSIQSNGQHQSSPKKQESAQKQTSDVTLKWKLPVSIPEGEFSKACGWLSDEEIVYITNKDQTSSLYSYNLFSGTSKQLYKSEFPIGFVQISPSKKYLLIQSSPSSYEGKMIIIDLGGNEKYSQIIPSYQLAFEWNPYQESQVLISEFQADWTFKVVLVDFEHKWTKELSMPQPFLKWIGKDRLAYLNWDHNEQKLSAPLVFHSLANGAEQTYLTQVYQYSAFKNIIMTITVNDKQKKDAKYSFYDKNLHLAYSFTMPQLAKFSDWLVPFYDFNDKQQQFITFRPKSNGDADTYKDGFQLASYDVKKRKSTVLINGLDNEPFSVSPSGEALLYGSRLEKMIELPEKKIKAVVKE
jgi:hypothetical protein